MRKKYVAPSMREFNVPCEAIIMAGQEQIRALTHP